MAPINWTQLVSHGLDATGKAALIALKSAKGNPAMAGAIAIGTGGLAMVTAPGVVVAPVVGALHYVGFGAGGIVAGTQAAAAQATIGNVVAPGMFATLTSAGAGGYGVAAIAGTVQWAGGTMMGLAGAAGTWLTAGKGAGH